MAGELRARGTRRAYDSDWRQFTEWCRKNGLASLPAEPNSIERYITYLSKPEEGKKARMANTIIRQLYGIEAAHTRAYLKSPFERNGQSRLIDTIRKIRWSLAAQEPKKQKPLTPALISRILKALDGSILGARNRAILLIGVAGSLRSSELAGMGMEDLEWHERGITIKLPRLSRSRRHDANARTVTIRFIADDRACPVKALKDWLKIASIDNGRVFRRLFSSMTRLESRFRRHRSVN